MPVKLSRQERPFRKREVRSSNLRTGLEQGCRGSGVWRSGKRVSLIRRRSLVRIQPRRLRDGGVCPCGSVDRAAGFEPAERRFESCRGCRCGREEIRKVNPPGRGACLENGSDGSAVWGSRPPPSASPRERRLRGNDTGFLRSAWGGEEDHTHWSGKVSVGGSGGLPAKQCAPALGSGSNPVPSVIL